MRMIRAQRTHVRSMTVIDSPPMSSLSTVCQAWATLPLTGSPARPIFRAHIARSPSGRDAHHRRIGYRTAQSTHCRAAGKTSRRSGSMGTPQVSHRPYDPCPRRSMAASISSRRTRERSSCATRWPRSTARVDPSGSCSSSAAASAVASITASSRDDSEWMSAAVRARSAVRASRDNRGESDASAPSEDVMSRRRSGSCR